MKGNDVIRQSLSADIKISIRRDDWDRDIFHVGHTWQRKDGSPTIKVHDFSIEESSLIDIVGSEIFDQICHEVDEATAPVEIELTLRPKGFVKFGGA